MSRRAQTTPHLTISRPTYPKGAERRSVLLTPSAAVMEEVNAVAGQPAVLHTAEHAGN